MEKDIENLIEQLTKVRPEMLSEEALKLFNTIMAVLDERDKRKEHINKRIADVEKCYNDLIKPYYDEKLKIINVSLMSKKEKEEFINKRNCLLVQRECYKETLEFMEDK